MLQREERAASVDRAPALNHHNHRTALTWRRTELMLVEVDVNGQSVQHRRLLDDDPGCGRRRHGHRGGIGGGYEQPSPEICHTRARASFLLGMPEAEFSRISKESGLGHVELTGNEKETYFIYEELQRICLLAARQMEVFLSGTTR